MEKRRVLHLMGTVITLTVFHPEAERLLDQCEEMLKDYQQRFSANDASSTLMQVNANAGQKPMKVDTDLYQLIRYGYHLSLSSDARFNLVIGPLIKLWRIGFTSANVPSDEAIQERMKLIDLAQVELDDENETVYLAKAGMEMDLGALAKGYFADRLKDYLKSEGVTAGIIDLGGNVLTIGKSPKSTTGFWQIGIQDPIRQRGNLMAAVAIQDQSVVTSGIYERFIKIGDTLYHHIFDSTTGYPVESEIASVTIVSDDSIDGEVWTTLLFADSPEEALRSLNHNDLIEGIIITRKQEMLVSENLKPFVTLV